MNKYNIDDYTEFSNDVVFKGIKMVINGKIKNVQDDPILEILFVSYLMKYISDETLLNSTLRLLFESSWLKRLKSINDLLLEKVIPNLIYTEQDCTKIRAIVFSLLLEHEVNSKIITNNGSDSPTFKFEVNGREIWYNNLNEKTLNSWIDLATEHLDKQTKSKSKKENDYNKVVRILHKLKRDGKTNFYNYNIDYLNGFKGALIKNSTSHVNKPIITELYQVFEHISKYKKIMQILASENIVHQETYISNDEKKGSKGFLASLLKDLHSKGFYKKNTRLTNEQIEEICKNTFGLTISIDTIKRAKSENFNFSFIPIASTLD